MSGPLHVAADKVVYSFSPKHPPAAAVDAGATIVVETRDAYDRRFQRGVGIEQYLRERSGVPGNPATGPIFVRGLRPGDGLNATVQRIELGAVGYVAAVPGIGVLGDTAIEPRVCRFEVRPNGLYYEGRLRLPLRPMIGTIGVAPAEGEIRALELGPHGGNLDCNDVAEGATLHLPVFAPGGLLAVGDVHAAMGFGEVYSGVNIDAAVTMRLDRVPQAGWTMPWLENGREIMTIGVAEQIDQAIRQATESMTEYISYRLGVSHTEAVALSGACCDIRLGQASRFGVRVSAYAVVPRSVFDANSTAD